MWALFANGEQVSPAFRTEMEVWHLARKSSLVDAGRLLEGFEIRQITDDSEAAWIDEAAAFGLQSGW